MSLYHIKDSAYWWVSVTCPRTGRRIRKSTRLTDKTLAQAFEQQLVASLVLGEGHYALEVKIKEYTWQDAAERWLKETQHKKDAHNDVYKVEWLRSHLGKIPLNQITPDLLKRIADTKANETSPATANRTLALLRAVLRKAYREWGWLKNQPYISLFPERKRRIRYLTREEADRLLSILPEHLKAMALFSLSTGLRASNVTGLKWSQVDLERSHLWIHPDQAKAGKAISVPLNEEAVSVYDYSCNKVAPYSCLKAYVGYLVP